jgi:vancomycin resistance protein YoaR
MRVLFGLLLTTVVLCLTDIVVNYGKIHSGVSVAGIDVGGMTEQDAAQYLDRELTARIEASPIELMCDQLTLRNLLDIRRWGPSVELDANLQDATGMGIDPLLAQAWRIRPLTVSASVDGEALAAEAYAVGRAGSFFTGRLRAWFVGVELPGQLVYDRQQLNGLISLLNRVLGEELVNADIVFSGGRFVVSASAAGFGVDEQLFVEYMDKAFLSETRAANIPLTDLQPLISDQEAQALADRCNAAIADPVILIAEGDKSWSIDASHLGSWMESRVEEVPEEDSDAGNGAESGAGAEGGGSKAAAGTNEATGRAVVREGDGKAAADGPGSSGTSTTQPKVRLMVSVVPDKMRQSLSAVLEGYDPGMAPVNAQFAIVSGSVTIIPSEPGRGIDYPKLANDLERILFDPLATDRQLQLSVTVLNPSFSTADAEAMHITQKISYYTTSYGWSTPARANNVEVASGYVSNSLIAPGQIWSFNATSGDATIERGYQMSKVISGSEYVDEVGGGVCQVATTVFNAVFIAGYPIIDRANHGLVQWQYELGRDAAVFYPWLDMKWQNDSSSWIFLTVTCVDGFITCTLWGTDPGYRGVIESGATLPGEEYATQRKPNDEMFIGDEKTVTQGKNGTITSVTRIVYDTNGNELRRGSWKSVYSPVTEVIEFGTKAPERLPDLEPPPSSSTDGSSP